MPGGTIIELIGPLVSRLGYSGLFKINSGEWVFMEQGIRYYSVTSLSPLNGNTIYHYVYEDAVRRVPKRELTYKVLAQK